MCVSTVGGATTQFLTQYSGPQNAVIGTNFTFQWKYQVADMDKPNFESIYWGIRKLVIETLVYVISSGAVETSKAPARYKDRIKWTGNLSTHEASFVLSNVSSEDEKKYGIEITFGPLVELKKDVELKVLGK